MGTSGYQNHQRSSRVSCFLIIGISVVSVFLFIKLWSMSIELNQIREDQELLQDSFNDKTKKLEQSLLTATQLKQENDRVKLSLEDLQSQKDQCVKDLTDRQVEVDNEKMRVANVQEELILTQENATSYLQQLAAELRKKTAEYATLATIKKALMDGLNETQTELKRCNSKVSTMQCPPCPSVPQAAKSVVAPSEPQPDQTGAVPSVPIGPQAPQSAIDKASPFKYAVKKPGSQMPGSPPGSDLKKSSSQTAAAQQNVAPVPAGIQLQHGEKQMAMVTQPTAGEQQPAAQLGDMQKTAEIQTEPGAAQQSGQLAPAEQQKLEQKEAGLEPVSADAAVSEQAAAPITAGNKTAKVQITQVIEREKSFAPSIQVEGSAASTAKIAASNADLSPAQRETPQEINPESKSEPVIQAGDAPAALGNKPKLDSAGNDPVPPAPVSNAEPVPNTNLKPEVTDAQAVVLNASSNDAAAVETGAESSADKQKPIDDTPAQIPLPLNEESQRDRAEAAAEAGDLQAQKRWLETNTSISDSSSVANTIINSNNTSLSTIVIGGRTVLMLNVTTISNASSLHRPTLQEAPSQAVSISDTQGNVEGKVAANPAAAEAAASVADNESIEKQRLEPAHLEPQADADAKVDANVEKLDKLEPELETGLDGDLQQPGPVIRDGDNISENAAAKLETGDMQNMELVEPKPDAVIAQDDDQEALSPMELVQPVPVPQEPMLEQSREDYDN